MDMSILFEVQLQQLEIELMMIVIKIARELFCWYCAINKGRVNCFSPQVTCSCCSVRRRHLLHYFHLTGIVLAIFCIYANITIQFGKVMAEFTKVYIRMFHYLIASVFRACAPVSRLNQTAINQPCDPAVQCYQSQSVGEGQLAPKNIRMMNVRIIIFYCSLAFSGFGSLSLDADVMCKVKFTMAEEICLRKSVCVHVQLNNILSVY